MNTYAHSLFAVAGARTRTRSTTNAAYACSPSSSHPIAGNNLKNRLVAAASRDWLALSNSRRKIASNSSRADCSVWAGGRWLSGVGCTQSMRASRRRAWSGTYDGGLRERACDDLGGDGHRTSAMSCRGLPVPSLHSRLKGGERVLRPPLSIDST